MQNRVAQMIYFTKVQSRQYSKLQSEMEAANNNYYQYREMLIEDCITAKGLDIERNFPDIEFFLNPGIGLVGVITFIPSKKIKHFVTKEVVNPKKRKGQN